MVRKRAVREGVERELVWVQNWVEELKSKVNR